MRRCFAAFAVALLAGPSWCAADTASSRPAPAALRADGPLGPEAHSAGLDARYLDAQAAFLREEFQQVVRVVKPLAAEPSGELAAALAVPTEAERALQLWLWYVLSLERLQQPGEALRGLDELKTALARAPGAESLWPEALFWEGEISRRAGKLGRAKLAYERILERFPASSWRPKAQVGLALLMVQEGGCEAARKMLASVMAEQPTTAVGEEALLLDGVCASRLGHPSEAVPILQKALAASPEPLWRAQALVALGDAFDQLGDVDQAVQSYSEARLAAPGSAWADAAAFGVGWTYFHHHRCQESLRAFESYRPAAPAADGQDRRLPMLFAKGRCLMEQGDDAGALAAFEALRAEDPEHDVALEAALSMAELYERRQRFTDAEEMVALVSRQAFNPLQQMQALLRLGSLRLAQGRTQEARAAFESAQQATDDVELRQAALNGMGDVDGSEGRADEAIRTYTRAWQLNPVTHGGLYASYHIAWLHLQTGHPDRALSGFQAVRDGSDSGLALEARLALAFIWISQDDLDQAALELDELQSAGLAPRQAARAEYYRALIAMHAGNSEEAAQRSRRVVEQSPSSEEALEARLLLLDIATASASPEEGAQVLDAAWADASALPPTAQGRLAHRLADLAYRAGDYPKARAWYEMAREQPPALRGELDYRAGSCYEEEGDLAAAIARYQAVTDPAWRVRGHLAAARLLERQERWAEALALYQALVQQDAPEAKFAAERISALTTGGSGHDH